MEEVDDLLEQHDRLAGTLHPWERPSFDDLVRLGLDQGLHSQDVLRWILWAERNGLLEVTGEDGDGRLRHRVSR